MLAGKRNVVAGKRRQQLPEQTCDLRQVLVGKSIGKKRRHPVIHGSDARIMIASHGNRHVVDIARIAQSTDGLADDCILVGCPSMKGDTLGGEGVVADVDLDHFFILT